MSLKKTIHFDMKYRPVRKVSAFIKHGIKNLAFYDDQDCMIDNYNPLNRKICKYDKLSF